jgi:hypothetical protein
MVREMGRGLFLAYMKRGELDGSRHRLHSYADQE